VINKQSFSNVSAALSNEIIGLFVIYAINFFWIIVFAELYQRATTDAEKKKGLRGPWENYIKK
jgi:hypothetical protein